MRRLSFLVVLFTTFALLAFKATGQTNQSFIVVPPPGLPDSLPIGSQEKMMTGILSHSNSVQLLNVFTPTVPTAPSEVGIVTVNSWPSYGAWKSAMVSNAWFYYSKYESSMVAGSEVKIWIDSVYKDFPITGNDLFHMITVRSYVGSVGSITLNSFAEAMPTNVYPEYAIVAVTNLQKFEVQVHNDDGSLFYGYIWPTSFPKPNVAPGFPQELTTNSWLILNSWYSSGTNHVWIGLTALGGNTMWYTGDGAMLKQPVLQMAPDARSLTVYMTSGADTYVESTCDNVHWSQEAFLPYSLHSPVATIPISNTGVVRIFRARTPAPVSLSQ